MLAIFQKVTMKSSRRTFSHVLLVFNICNLVKFCIGCSVTPAATVEGSTKYFHLWLLYKKIAFLDTYLTLTKTAFLVSHDEAISCYFGVVNQTIGEALDFSEIYKESACEYNNETTCINPCYSCFIKSLDLSGSVTMWTFGCDDDEMYNTNMELLKSSGGTICSLAPSANAFSGVATDQDLDGSSLMCYCFFNDCNFHSMISDKMMPTKQGMTELLFFICTVNKFELWVAALKHDSISARSCNEENGALKTCLSDRCLMIYREDLGMTRYFGTKHYTVWAQ